MNAPSTLFKLGVSSYFCLLAPLTLSTDVFHVHYFVVRIQLEMNGYNGELLNEDNGKAHEIIHVLVDEGMHFSSVTSNPQLANFTTRVVDCTPCGIKELLSHSVEIVSGVDVL